MIIWFNEIGISFVRGGGSEPPACDSKPLKITFSVEDGMEYRYYYDTDTSKWYIRNDQGQYEEYGRYDASSATTYEGKLVVSDGYEYEWDGTQWVNLGETTVIPRENCIFYKTDDNLTRNFRFFSGDTPSQNFYDADLNMCAAIFDTPLTSIPLQGFHDATGVTHIYLPDTITSLGGECFSGMATLQYLYLPSGLTSIGSLVFWYSWRTDGGYSVVDFGNERTSTISLSGVGGLPSGSKAIVPDSLYNSSWSLNGFTKTKFSDYYPQGTSYPKISSLPKKYPSIDTYENWADSEFNYPETFNTQDSKWWVKNNQNHYEEYGVYADSIDSGVTTYEGKLALIPVDSGSTVDEYEYSGGTWNYLGSGSSTPYTEVEYLQRTTKSNIPCFDTGIRAGGTTVFKGKLSFDANRGWNYLVGNLGQTNPSGQTSSSDDNDWRLFVLDSGGIALDMKNLRGNTTGMTYNTMYNIEFSNNYVKDLDLGTYYYSGTPVDASWESGGNVFLFCPSSSKNDIGKIGACQIFNDGVLVRDFVPCLDENEVPSFYDKVTRQYFHSITSSVPTAGPEVSPAGSLPKVYADKPAPDLEMAIASIYCDLYQDSAITAGNYIGREAVVLDEAAVYKVNSGKKWEYLYPISNTLTYTTTDGELIESIPASGWGANLLANIVLDGDNTLVFDTAPTAMPAMSGQTKLVGMELPEGLTSIPANAFSGCTALRSIDIPAGVTSIGDNAFRGCTSITGMILPSGLTSIGSGIFNGCSYLTSIDIPSGITSIPNEAFEGCTNLTGIIIPSGVTSIGSSAFQGCTHLTGITLPSGVTTVQNKTFSGCTSLSSITFNGNVTRFNEDAFRYCAFSSITIPDTVTYMGKSVFEGCRNMTEIHIGSGVTSLPTSFAFACSGLTTVDWGSNCRVTSIGADAFVNCKALSSITIPVSLNSIGIRLFNECNNLSEIIAYPTVAPALGSATYFQNVAPVGTLYVPANADYSTWLAKLPSGWSVLQL